MKTLALFALSLATLSACSDAAESPSLASSSPANAGASGQGAGGVSAGAGGGTGAGQGGAAGAGGVVGAVEALWSRVYGGHHDDAALDLAVDGEGRGWMLLRALGDLETKQGKVSLSGAVALVEVGAQGEALKALPLTADKDRNVQFVAAGGGDLFLLGDGSATGLELGDDCRQPPSAQPSVALIRLHRDGSCGWLRQLPLSMQVVSLAASPGGEVVIAGACHASADLGGGVAMKIGANWGPVAVPCQVLVGPDGAPRWARAMTEDPLTQGYSEARILEDGSVVVTGVAGGVLHPGDGAELPAGGFAARYGADGALRWASPLAGAIAVTAAADATHGVFVQARTGGASDLVRLDVESGGELWRRPASAGDVHLSLAVGAGGELLVAGWLWQGDSVWLGGEALSAEGYGWLEAGLSPEGERRWASMASSAKPTGIRRALAGPGGALWTLGEIMASIDVGDGQQSWHAPSVGEASRDVLLVRRPRVE